MGKGGSCDGKACEVHGISHETAHSLDLNILMNMY
jgi:hypothetical protein